jgi:hypothetical protein
VRLVQRASPAASGKLTEKMLPPRERLRAAIVPPWASTIQAAIARTGVGDRQAGGALRRRHLQRHRGGALGRRHGCRELDRVVHQVHDELPQPALVAQHGDLGVGGHPQVDVHVLGDR